MLGRVSSAVLVFVLVMLVAPAAQAAFVETTIEDGGTALTESTSATLSPSDRAYVAWFYGGDDLYWSKRTSTGWRTEQIHGAGTFVACIDSDFDWIGPSAGFRPDGTAHIAFACIAVGGGAKVYYARERETGWSTKSVGVGPSAASCNSSATDVDLLGHPTSGRPVIVITNRCTYEVTGFFLKSGKWTKEVLVPGSFGAFRYGTLDLAIDPTNGKIAMVLNSDVYGRGTLSFWEFSWSGQQIGSEEHFTLPGADVAKGEPSLVFSLDGTGHIAFQQGSAYGTPSGDAYGFLSLMTRTEGVWGPPATVDDSATLTGAEPSMSYAGGLVQIAYHDETNRDLRYATSADGTTWDLKAVLGVNDTGRFPSMVVTDAGRAVITYFDATDVALRSVAGR